MANSDFNKKKVEEDLNLKRELKNFTAKEKPLKKLFTSYFQMFHR